MTNEEVMNLLTDMGLHDGGMENWIPDNAWVRVVNKVIEIEREKSDRRMVRQRNNFGKVLLKAVADEREACAKLVEADGIARGVTRDTGLVLVKNANRIRARGEK